MANRLQLISLIMLALAARHVASQTIMGKMHATDALWNGVQKDAMHSHLQRMLQMEAEREPEAPGGHELDDFGIPLPAVPKESHLSAKQQMHVAPQKTLTKQATKEQGSTSNADRPHMTEQEAEQLAAKQAANTAAREAALARKRQIVQEELAAAAASKKAKRSAAATASARRTTPTKAEQRRRTASTTIKDVKPAAAAASWGMIGYILLAILALGSAVALFVTAAVVENALLARKAGGDWLSLTRGLWRRCRRAFAAARKQLTGHGSDLPLSANEGTGTVARAFAAASAFVHVFWTHLADHRGQHLGGAVTAALHASRRASTGGCIVASAAVSVVPDRSSAGGAYPAPVSPSSSPSYYASIASPFSAPHYQRRRA